MGAVVVGGGTTLNGASQITNGGTNAGSNLTAARNLFTGTDQVTITHGIHLITVGVWFERLQSNNTLLQDQYGQASFSNLADLPRRHGEHLHLRPVVYAAHLAVARRRVLSPRTPSSCSPASSFAWVSAVSLPMAGMRPIGRASNYAFVKWRDPDPAGRRQFGVLRE